MTDRSPRLSPMALLAGMVLEDGRTWGEAAFPFQHDDAAAVFDSSRGAPLRHYSLRGRGLSKTTDKAGIALALILTEAPPRARCHVFAVDSEQAGIFMDALAGLVARTPGLSGAVEVGARAVMVKSTRATLTVEASDGASAFGARPWLQIVDELGMWPSTANHRRLWSAIVSAQPKVPGSRLLVIGTAGSPTGLAASVWAEAAGSPHWRTSRHPGPSPWWTPEDVEATRASLTASEWRRLILCEFAEGDDALTTTEDVEAAIRAGSAVLPARRGVSYTAALDVGTRRDLTALVVGHAERRPAGRVIVIDRVMTWRPTDGPGGRVDLSEVEASTRRLLREYNGARLRFDRMQAEQLATNLSREGYQLDEFIFSAAGVNRLARGLWTALRDRALSLPDDSETRTEFLATRLVETGPSTLKLVNPPGQHDDIVTAVGMVVADLTERPDPGSGIITSPVGRAVGERTLQNARPALPLRTVVERAARRGPRGVRGIFVPGSANDPTRRRRM